MLPRRDVLKLAAVGPAYLALKSAAHAQEHAAPPFSAPTYAVSASTPFAPNIVLDIARSIAKAPYRAPSSDLPDPFNGLNFEQYVGIRVKPANRIWLNDNLDFVIEPLHRGFLFATPMLIHIVEGGQSLQLAYRQDDFEFGAIKPPSAVSNLGFSGFRVLVRGENGLEEVAIFQGASFFRSHAPGQPPGVAARALALKTGDPRGEEFPIFKAVWIERPEPGANRLTIYGLVDSESVTGSYRFTLRPGEATIIDTELTLIPRANVDHVGVAAMSGASLSTPLDRRRPDDLRPTIAELNGLQMYSGKGEWIWRPVANRTTLQLSSFMDDNPKGFGFLMRDRRFEDYQDDEARWNERPSLWVEPLADFGPGAVSLVEIPAESESNSNCICYWRPNGGIVAGKELSFAYRQFWCWEPPSRPPLLIARSSRSGKIGGKKRRFVVTFTGESLGENKPAVDLKPTITVNPGALIAAKAYIYRASKAYRVVFDLDPGAESYSEIRLVIESAGVPMSETWLYRWTA